MITTARNLLLVAIALVLLAGYLASPIASSFLVVAAGALALLAWAAFLLYLRDRNVPRPPRAPLVRWQDGR